VQADSNKTGNADNQDLRFKRPLLLDEKESVKKRGESKNEKIWSWRLIRPPDIADASYVPDR